MILIVTQDGDRTAHRVGSALEQRGGDVFFFDPGDMPDRASLTFQSCNEQGLSGVIESRGESRSIGEIRAVWFRRPRTPGTARYASDARMQSYVATECNEALLNLWYVLACPWVPGPFALLARAERKLVQLELAQRLGFELPDTTMTNRPRAILDSYRRHNGHIISKTLGCGLDLSFPEIARYTQAVTTRDLVHIASTRLAPVVIQPNIPKQIEVRVTVVGDVVLAAEISSQTNHRSRQDWRRYTRGRTQHSRHDLPRELTDRCIRLVRELGLCFGAIDLILTPDGRYLFLEINPNGEWSWIEAATDLPITETMCNLFAQLTATAEPESALEVDFR